MSAEGGCPVALRWVKVGEGREVLMDDTPKPEAKSAPFVRNERLSPKAKRALEIQTGRKFDSESSVRAYLRDNDLRIVEGSEGRERRKWIKGTKPGDRGKYHHTNHLGYGVR